MRVRASIPYVSTHKRAVMHEAFECKRLTELADRGAPTSVEHAEGAEARGRRMKPARPNAASRIDAKRPRHRGRGPRFRAAVSGFGFRV